MNGEILILRTGEPPRRVKERYGSYDQAIINALGGEGKFVVVDAQREPLPESTYKGIIITGSAASAYDEDIWIRKSADFLRQAADKAIPIYGICFGHQLLAQTFGGKVEKCPHGWELGTASISLDRDALHDPLFTGLPAEFLAQESHGDVVIELPLGAVQLAGNAHWPIQAFRLGERIWGTQFHPEFNLGIIAGLVESLTASLPARVFPALNAEQSITEQIRAGLRETPQARDCLENFLRYVNDP